MNKKLFLCLMLIMSNNTAIYSDTGIKQIAQFMGGGMRRFQVSIVSLLVSTGFIFAQERKINTEIASLGIASFALSDLMYAAINLAHTKYSYNSVQQNDEAPAKTAAGKVIDKLSAWNYAPSLLSVTAGSGVALYAYYQGYLK